MLIFFSFEKVKLEKIYYSENYNCILFWKVGYVLACGND